MMSSRSNSEILAISSVCFFLLEVMVEIKTENSIRKAIIDPAITNATNKPFPKGSTNSTLVTTVYLL